MRAACATHDEARAASDENAALKGHGLARRRRCAACCCHGFFSQVGRPTFNKKTSLFFFFLFVALFFVCARMATTSYLVYGGKTGWIGQKVLAMLQAQGIPARAAEARLEKVEQVAAELDAFKPTHVLNCAGLTGRPNVDWCEDHKDEVVRVNVIGTLGLLDACEARGIHCTNFATG